MPGDEPSIGATAGPCRPGSEKTRSLPERLVPTAPAVHLDRMESSRSAGPACILTPTGASFSSGSLPPRFGGRLAALDQHQADSDFAGMVAKLDGGEGSSSGPTPLCARYSISSSSLHTQFVRAWSWASRRYVAVRSGCNGESFASAMGLLKILVGVSSAPARRHEGTGIPASSRGPNGLRGGVLRPSPPEYRLREAGGSVDRPAPSRAVNPSRL